MSLLSNVQNVAYAGRFPTDKIVNVLSGSFDAAAATTVGGYLKRASVSHGYTRPVFTKLKWSTDGTNWVDGGFSYRSGDSNLYPALSYSDATSVYILTGVTAGTVYYEVVCFWIDNYDGTSPLIGRYQSPTKDTVFDSRVNYQKIIDQNVVSFTGASDSETITHGLGYYPNARVFYEAFSGEVWPAIAGGISNYFLYDFSNQAQLEYKMSTSALQMDYSGTVSTGTRRAWYRIYLDA